MVVSRVSPRTCRRGHEITPENETTGSKCKQCVRERMRAWRAGVKREAAPLVGQCVNGHEYDEENTYWYRGHRQCKTCRRVRVMESWWRHREKRLAENQAWRTANREQWLEGMKAWRLANPERANLLGRLKKQRRRNAGTLTVAEWELVLQAYGEACLACEKPEVTIDHVIPVSCGGPNTIDNVQPLCSWCNTSKGTKTIDYRPAPIADLIAIAG